MGSGRTLKLLSLTMAVLLLGYVRGQQNVVFSVSADIKPGTFIGDISKEAGLESENGLSALSGLKFHLVPSSNGNRSVIDLDNKSGILKKSQSVDYGSLCGEQESCHIKLGVIIQPLKKNLTLTVVVSKAKRSGDDSGIHDRRSTTSLPTTPEPVSRNEHAPRFQLSRYNISLKEDIPVGTGFVVIAATDPDRGLAGKVRYNVLYPSHTFGIEPESGKLYTKKQLDFEKSSGYNLVIQAVDQGSPSLSSTARVDVHVLDINDNAPEIRLRSIGGGSTIYIKENQTPGSFITLIKVHDKDSGRNGQFHCIVDDDVNFRLMKRGPGMYILHSSRSFDRERMDEHYLTMTCRDSGYPSLSSQEKIKVRVVDVNDNSPMFARASYEVSVVEGSPIGTYLIQVSAVDADAGKNGEVYFSTIDELISVDERTGVVRSNVVFDYEMEKQFTFTVGARDKGRPLRYSSTKIIVNIQNINDNGPIFSITSYIFYLHENQPVGTEIGQVTAIDRDGAPFNKFEYRIVRDSGCSIIVNTSTGEITSGKTMDREQSPVCRLTVAAVDKHLPFFESTTNVTVYVADKNDNAPIVEFPNSFNHTIWLSNNLTVGAEVARIIAHDADAGKNAELTYNLVEPTNSIFALEQDTGVLSLATSNENLTRSGMFIVRFLVADGGNPELTANGLLKVVFS